MNLKKKRKNPIVHKMASIKLNALLETFNKIYITLFPKEISEVSSTTASFNSSRVVGSLLYNLYKVSSKSKSGRERSGEWTSQVTLTNH